MSIKVWNRHCQKSFQKSLLVHVQIKGIADLIFDYVIKESDRDNIETILCYECDALLPESAFYTEYMQYYAARGRLDLLKKCRVEVDSKDGLVNREDPRLALSAAIMYGHEDIIDYLLLAYKDLKPDIDDIYEALQNGQLNIVKCYSHLLPRSSEPLKYSMKSDNLILAEWLFTECERTEGQINNDRIVTDAVDGGNLEMVKWAIDHDGVITDFTFRKAVLKCSKPILELLCQHRKPSWDLLNRNRWWFDNFGDRLSFIQWIHANYKDDLTERDYQDLGKTVIRKGYIEILQWLHTICNMLTHDHAQIAVDYGRLLILQWMESQGYVFRSVSEIVEEAKESRLREESKETKHLFLNKALRQGHIHVINYLKDRAIIDVKLDTDCALRSKNPEVLDYFFGCGVPITKSSVYRAIKYGNVEALKRMEQLYMCMLKEHPQNLLTTPIVDDTTNVLSFLEKRGLKYTHELCKATMMTALEFQQFYAVKWLIKKCGFTQTSEEWDEMFHAACLNSDNHIVRYVEKLMGRKRRYIRLEEYVAKLK